MELHDQPIFDRHLGHFNQHMAIKAPGLLLGGCALCHAEIERPRLCEPFGVQDINGMIGGGCAAVYELRTAHAQSGQIAVKTVEALIGDPCQLRKVSGEIWIERIEHPIGAKGWDHPAGPMAGAKALVVGQIIQGRVGGGEGFNVKALKQCTGQKLRLLQTLRDVVVDRICGLRSEGLRDLQCFTQHILHPQPGGCAEKQVPMRGEEAKYLAWICLSARRANSKVCHGDTLGIEHTKHIVIRRDQKRSRIGERLILRKPTGIAMPMGGHNW